MVKPIALMALPAELRNTIYRLALCQQETVAIQPEQHREPSLLQVSKQIRAETVPIFYLENSFSVQVRDYESTVLIKWSRINRQCKQEYGSTTTTSLPNGQTPNWPNVLEWLKRFHAGEVDIGYPRPDPVNGAVMPAAYLQRHVVASCFGLVESLRSKYAWEDIEHLIENQHVTLVGMNGLWQ